MLSAVVLQSWNHCRHGLHLWNRSIWCGWSIRCKNMTRHFRNPGPRNSHSSHTTLTLQTRTKTPGGGGGAWRAFIHVNYAGQRGGRALWKKIAEEYRNLDAASKAHYVRIGKLGTIAWRARGGKKRHVAFGKPLEASQPSNYGPNQITDAGVIVATDADRPQALVSRVACKFDKGLKALRSEQRLAVKAMKQEMEKEESALNKHTQEALLSTPWVVPGVCASDTFHDASAGGCSCKITKLEWNAPVAAFTDVPGRSCIY